MAVKITVAYPASTKYPSFSSVPSEMKSIPYDGKKSPSGAIIGVTNKTAPNATMVPLICFIVFPLTMNNNLGLIYRSSGIKMFKISFNIRSRSLFDIL